MKKTIALLLTFVTLLSYADAKEDLAAEDLHIPDTGGGRSSAVKKGKVGRSCSPPFCVSARVCHAPLPKPDHGEGGSAYLFLHEIGKPPALFSAATFTKDKTRTKKLLTFGVHLAMIQPSQTR